MERWSIGCSEEFDAVEIVERKRKKPLLSDTATPAEIQALENSIETPKV
jgi:hypothetical protein